MRTIQPGIILSKAWHNRWVKRITPVLTGAVLFYLLCLNHNEPTQIGIARNRVNGAMWTQRGGWHLTSPWVSVARVDTRPMRVAVNSAGHGYSAKLIQFAPEHWQEFVTVEGFRYWWWANRFSFNGGYDEEYRGMRDILRGHAYGTKSYPFLRILNEYQ